MTGIFVSRHWAWVSVMTRNSIIPGNRNRLAGNRYSRLLFSNEDLLYANLRMQKQLGNIRSQCQFLAFAWRHRLSCGDAKVPSENTDRPWRKWRNKQSMDILSELCVQSERKITCKKYSNIWVTVNTDFCDDWGVSAMIFPVNSSLVKTIAESPHSWQKSVFGNICIMQHLHTTCFFVCVFLKSFCPWFW